MSERRPLHQFNIWAGRVVPLIVLAALGYTLYVITYEIAGKYRELPAESCSEL
jgi:hypothetical protein